MHQPVRDYLEDYLRDPGNRRIPEKFHSHLASCSACAQELELLEGQKRMLQSLRGAAQFEPPAGFYASVMARVEEQTNDSFWTVFLDPAFGRRLAIAAGTLVLLLGTYMVTTEPFEHTASPSGMVMSQDRSNDAIDGSVQPKQRDAVLVNLVTYRE